MSGIAAQALRRMIALAMALLLVPMGQAELFAQQAPPPQSWSQSDAPRGDYAPNQSGAAQPYYQPFNPASGDVNSAQDYGQQQAPPQARSQQQQLQQLVAPIALYPDPLVAQVLTASTYPGQIVEADNWRQEQSVGSTEQMVAAADGQSWDPSVKALTAFPQVLTRMNRNLPWTTDLGNAYYNQPQDVLQAVQDLRGRAVDAGNLQSTPQEEVSYDQGYIALAPANPQVVYVPVYNPWSVYGDPVSPYPGFSLFGALGSFFGSAPVSYGLGIAMNAFASTPWGWLAWGLSWLASSVLFQNSGYWSHSNSVADWGLPNGGPRAFSGGRGGMNVAANGQGWPRGGYGGNGLARGNGDYGIGNGTGFVHRPPNAPGGYKGGLNAGRGDGFVHQPANFGGPNSGYNIARGNGNVNPFVHRPPNAYGPQGIYSAARGNNTLVHRPPYTSGQGGGYARGYQTSRVGQPMGARNQLQSPFSRQQSSYRSPMSNYRAPSAGNQHS